ncbi:ribulose-phosphate 3-epimerase [Candidatus Daviesbacteria bacterium]|nr:ribulose-phosphate 3-epimerase [Candidatus Daviesbacteria bacterium]
MDEVQIIPAILATTEAEYKEKLTKIESSDELIEGWVQIDLMDNKFVQNQSIGVDIVAKYQTKLKIEAQLMVEYPENWIDGLAKASVRRVVFPVEDQSGIDERIKQIKELGMEVGLSINPETEVNLLEPYAGLIDLVLVMSVHPGFGGQNLLPGTFEKIKVIKGQNWNLPIEVDGGVNETNAKQLVEAGATNLVIGSHLIEGRIDENLERIWEVIQS